MNCAIEGCVNEISKRSKLTICQLCRSGLYYWLKKRPAQMLERRRKLTMYGARLDTLIERRKPKAVPSRRAA
jgi:hypothetical protein